MLRIMLDCSPFSHEYQTGFLSPVEAREMRTICPLCKKYVDIVSIREIKDLQTGELGVEQVKQH